MKPSKDRFDDNEQNHPIDEDIVSEIAGANSIPPRVLDSALWRFSRSLDSSPVTIADLVSSHNLADAEIHVEYVNDDLVIIEESWVFVAQWILWTGSSLRVSEYKKGEGAIPAMMREAHATQAARLSNSSGDGDEERGSALVLSRSAYSN